MRQRVAFVLALVVACCSCTPARDVRRAPVAPAATTAADRHLLQRLALADPVDDGATPTLPAHAPAAAAPPFMGRLASDEDQRRAADCLTSAIYYEARSEPIDGQRAVAQVVLNRVRDRAFPPSVCRVVYQRSAGGCQFSFVCDGSMNQPVDRRSWQIAEAVADAALGGSVFAPVGSATHYHTTAVLPWWASSLARIGTIGSHIFYRWGDRLSGALSFRQSYSGHEAVQIAASSAPLSAPDEPGYAAVSDEGGVTVHRGAAAAAQPVAAFGVRIHRGVTVHVGSGPAEPAAGYEASTD